MLMGAVVECRPVLVGRPPVVLRGSGPVLVRVLTAAGSQRVCPRGLRRLMVHDPLAHQPDHRLRVGADGQEQQQESEAGPHDGVDLYTLKIVPLRPAGERDLERPSGGYGMDTRVPHG